MFRRSCGSCHFCNTTRPSDITIADFWGWEKTDPHFNEDDKGCSLVLVNTEKGRKIFIEASKQMNVIPTELEKCLQTHLRKPSSLHPLSEKFESDYTTHGYKYVMKKYGNVGWISKIKRVLKRMFKL